jgi:acyl-CoA synthetase (AMP-forming)/AMP-acid ligase II/acyl carrier protein
MRGDCGAIWAGILAGGKRPFLIQPDRTWSHAELEQAVRRWLARFDALGLGAGDRVLMCLGDDMLVISCFVAALLDGKVPVNLSPDTPAAKLLALGRAAGARALVHDASVSLPEDGEELARIACVPADVRAGRGLLASLTPRDRLAELGLGGPVAARAPLCPASDDGLAYLLFTSGTTSAPVGVKISRANLFANLATISRLFGYSESSRIFNDMMLAHADGMIQGPVLALACGGAVVRAGGFALHRLEAWLGQVRAARATHVITVPTIWTMIDQHAAHDDYFDAPECVSLQSVAAKLPEALWARLESRFGMPIANHYGLTETVASALYAGPHTAMGGFGSIGKPVDCMARIDPDAGGVEGELQLRGANVSPGYWQDPARDAASFTTDGWLKTGDLARLNNDGSYAIIGRRKNVMLVGGILVRPDEIDEIMMQHPAVSASVTVGLGDAVFGEVPATAVVLKAAVDEAALHEHARANLEQRKQPRLIAVVDEIPRGLSGKPQLASLRETLMARQAAPEAGPHPVDDLAAELLALAAGVFRVPVAGLTLSAGPEDVAGWDSFSHINLVLEAEMRFGVRIPAARIAGIATLSDLHDAVRELL